MNVGVALVFKSEGDNEDRSILATESARLTKLLALCAAQEISPQTFVTQGPGYIQLNVLINAPKGQLMAVVEALDVEEGM